MVKQHKFQELPRTSSAQPIDAALELDGGAGTGFTAFGEPAETGFAAFDSPKEPLGGTPRHDLGVPQGCTTVVVVRRARPQTNLTIWVDFSSK